MPAVIGSIRLYVVIDGTVRSPKPDEPPSKKKKTSSMKSKVRLNFFYHWMMPADRAVIRQRHASTSDAPFAEFAPHIAELKKKYPVGSCTYHPGIRCFYDKQRNLHFELDKESLVFWANALYRVRSSSSPSSVNCHADARGGVRIGTA